MNKWTLEYTVDDKDYDFGTYRYVFIAGQIICTDENDDGKVLDYQVNYDINFEKDAEISWEMGYGMDPDDEGGLQPSIENLDELLAKTKRTTVLFDLKADGEWDDPKTHKTIEEAAAFLGCSKEELEDIIAQINDEADIYLESAIDEHLCSLEYERDEPDYDYDDWYNDYWD